eukprot:1929547-Rhodomonas_salina.2
MASANVAPTTSAESSVASKKKRKDKKDAPKLSIPLQNFVEVVEGCRKDFQKGVLKLSKNGGAWV